ncbi:copper radical oxidase [Collybia nuda]|uniref:Copper radical oxidase n=1 Tax=Collybia nuda TaxID=64659 RepID=A0A9P6CN36_9AGAR|nr:copper radical oxidase [Collybia nuda]
MWFIPLLSLLPPIVTASPSPPGWQFVQNGTTGIIPIEAIVVSPTLAVLFDRVQDDPLQINGHSAWSALWNFETNTATPLDVVSDTFCSSGGFLSNGTMVNVAGNVAEFPYTTDGRMMVRLFEPCTDASGVGCTITEDAQHLRLAANRWYTSTLRIFDGSLMIVGGTHELTNFYNTDPENTVEFFPSKDNGIPRPLPFLERTIPANLFPRVFALPDGKILMISNTQSTIYDVETNTETRLPDIPNGVRVSNPFDGTATLLPMFPPHFTPEVLVCGGSNISDTTPFEDVSAQDPASDQCSRITLTSEGIERGWEVERMLEGRIMSEMILMPDGGVLIISGGQTGYPSINTAQDRFPDGEQSNADHPAFTPVLYTPNAPAGHRFSNQGMPTTDIARLYHSSVTLTPNGNIFLAGSNPNQGIVNTTRFHSEFRVEYLNPSYMGVSRPTLRDVPKIIPFHHTFTITVDIPTGIRTTDMKVALMDLGFSSHAFHSSSRLVFMDAVLAPNHKTITITSPPNNRVYPPGPAYIFLTVGGVTSVGSHVLIGDGKAPPVKDQGIPLPP